MFMKSSGDDSFARLEEGESESPDVKHAELIAHNARRHKIHACELLVLKVVFLLTGLWMVVEVLVYEDKISAAHLVAGYGEHFDANGAIAMHMHEAHLRGEGFNASTVRGVTPDDMRPMLAMYAPEATNVFMSAQEDIELTLPLGQLTAEQLASMRNAELHEGIFTMHTMPNILVKDYSFFEQWATVTAYMLLQKSEHGVRFDGDEDGYYTFWLRKTAGNPSYPYVPFFNDRWVIYKQFNLFVVGVPEFVRRGSAAQAAARAASA